MKYHDATGREHEDPRITIRPGDEYEPPAADREREEAKIVHYDENERPYPPGQPHP